MKIVVIILLKKKKKTKLIGRGINRRVKVLSRQKIVKCKVFYETDAPVLKTDTHSYRDLEKQ